MSEPFTYRCAQCGGEFESEWSDDEARAEAVANGWDPEAEDMAIVCDDCHRAMRSLIPFPADIAKRRQ